MNQAKTQTSPEPTPIDQTRKHLRAAAQHAGEAVKSATEAAREVPRRHILSPQVSITP